MKFIEFGIAQPFYDKQNEKWICIDKGLDRFEEHIVAILAEDQEAYTNNSDPFINKVVFDSEDFVEFTRYVNTKEN